MTQNGHCIAIFSLDLMSIIECDNNVMDVAMQGKWENKSNGCTVPILVIKEVVVDYLFQALRCSISPRSLLLIVEYQAKGL